MSDSEVLIFFNGFLISLGLIVAIGPQNAFLLRKGLMKRHVFAVATACFVSDAFLIAIAVGGIGRLAVANPMVESITAWGGALFLIWFGYHSLQNAKNPKPFSEEDIEDAGTAARGKGVFAAMGVALMLTFLNPHVYLDTLIILGGLAAQYDHDWSRYSFGIGAILASAVWFYGIGYGARLLFPIFKEPKAWSILDLIITVIMWSIAAALIWGELFGEHVH